MRPGVYVVAAFYVRALGRPLVWISDRVFLRLGDRFLVDGTLDGTGLRLAVVAARRAVILVLKDKAEVLVSNGQVFRSEHLYVDASSVSGTLSSELGLDETPPADQGTAVSELRVRTVSGGGDAACFAITCCRNPGRKFSRSAKIRSSCGSRRPGS